MAETKSKAKAPAKAKEPAAPAAPRAKAEGAREGEGLGPGGEGRRPTTTAASRAASGAYRAKGCCYFHFKKWRQGELPHSRYRTCSKAECRLKAVRHGLCEKHEAEVYGKEPLPPPPNPRRRR